MFNPINKLMKKLAIVLTLSCITLSAWALSLDQAKEQGLVGELPNGYLGAVKSTSEVKQLVKSVNAKRKEIYLTLARKNKLTLDQVKMLAGKKALAKTKAGHFVQNASGQWVKK